MPRKPDPVVDAVRAVMDRYAGVLRDGDGLRAALAELEPHRSHETGLVGHLVVEAALRREESRGGHTRLDFPETAPVAEHILTVPSPAEAVAAK
jgi:L-aspartate oxidase